MPQKKYTHLNQFERDRIEALLSSGHKQKEIAGILQRDPGTISREIQRNRRKRRKGKEIRHGPYTSSLAQHKAYLRRHYAKYQGQKIENNPGLKEFVIKHLRKDWSPDDITGRLETKDYPFKVSKNAIYRWLYSVYGQRWTPCLYSQRHRPKRRKAKKSKKTLIPQRVGIELRPQDISLRKEGGHFEGDTVVSGKRHHSKVSLALVYERKYKYIAAQKIPNLKPQSFNQAMFRIKNKLQIKSLTLDNGIENQYHQDLQIKTYFCHPYSAWEKGGVENAVKLLRRYIPKGSDIRHYSENYLEKAVQILNHKPRKSLNYFTPYEMMQKHHLFKNSITKNPK